MRRCVRKKKATKLFFLDANLKMTSTWQMKQSAIHARNVSANPVRI